MLCKNVYSMYCNHLPHTHTHTVVPSCHAVPRLAQDIKLLPDQTPDSPRLNPCLLPLRPCQSIHLVYLLLNAIHRLHVYLVLKLEPLAARRVNGAAAVRPALALVLLLCEALALCDNELGVRAVRVVVRHVCVARQLGEHLDVGLDALEAVLNVVLLLLGLLGRGRG
jgi:hypothetical protein